MIFPLCIYAAISELVFAGWGVLCGQAAEEQMLPLTALSAGLASLLLGGEYYFARRRRGGGGKTMFCPIFWIVVSGVGTCLFFNALLSFLPLSWEEYGEVSRILYHPPLAIQLIGMGIVIPAAEELVFRGLGYYQVRQELPAGAAVFLSALCFGLYHGNLLQGLYAFLMGIFLAVLFEITDSILACWLFHATANVTAVVMTSHFSLQYGKMQPARLAVAAFVGGALFFTACSKMMMIPGSKGQKIRCKLACKRIFELVTRKNTEK